MTERISSPPGDSSVLPLARRIVGKPRSDPALKLLHQFYEPLVLLKILDRTRGGQNYLAEAEASDDSRSLWFRFLDQLSWICDYKHGGDTVSAIAAEATPSGPIFWLAANTNPQAKVIPHLEWVLNQLVRAHHASKGKLDSLGRTIVARCVEFSRQKVKTYGRYLRLHVQEAAKILAASSDSSDVQLLRDLINLDRLRSNNLKLCCRAYDFRSYSSMQTLARKSRMYSEGSGPSVWSTIRHIIGRLGAWSKASKIVMRVATEAPNSIYNYKIEYLVSPSPIPPPVPDSQTYLDAALRRMFQEHEKQRLERVQAVLANSRAMDIAVKFEAEYKDKKFKPRVHAELLLLEHFHHENLKFVDGYRYIGCSKPACYCCDLYIKFHPGKFIIRASHGNLWRNWRAPIPQRRVDPDAAQKHTDNILNDMIKRIRNDVIFQIESKAPPRPRVPDSTTGITTSFMASLPNRTLPEDENLSTQVAHERARYHCATSTASFEENESDNSRNNNPLYSFSTPHTSSTCSIRDSQQAMTGSVLLRSEDDIPSKAMMAAIVQDVPSQIQERMDSSEDEEDGGVLLSQGRRRSDSSRMSA